MRYIRIFISLLALFCLSVWADDATPDLYTARVTVTARTDDARTAAFQAGLRQVYMKLADRTEVSPALSKSIQNAPQWVDRFQYEQVGNDTYMLIRYNPDLVKKALKNADIVFSDEPRPTFIVWTAMPLQNNIPVVLTEQQVVPEALQIKKALWDAAARAGLVIQIPQGDPMDHVTTDDIAGVFDASIQEASSRYPTDGFIALSLKQEGDVWHIQWRATAKEIKAHGTSEGDLPTALDHALLQIAAGVMNGESLPEEGLTSGAEVTVVISDVNDIEAYTKIDAYLNTLPDVKEAETTEMTMPSVTFKVTLTGSASHFKKSLAAGPLLEPDEDESDETNAHTFHYHYVNP